MPKIKSVKGATKRFRALSSGKIKRKRAYLRHILTKKSSKNKRNLRQSALVSKSAARAVRRMAPYLAG